MAEHYYTVGVHGAPTPETAPHGFGYVADGDWEEGVAYDDDAGRKLASPHTVWWPLPAPPTEQAPPLEPVARWSYGRDQVYSMRLKLNRIPPIVDHEEAVRYRDALNALDRDGVAWGPGRPMSELPDGGAVLLLDDEGAFCVLPIETVFAWSVFVCWWPLPEATT